jgi:hypothetical protein
MSDNAEELQPLSLIEDAETGDRFALYASPSGCNLDLWFDGDEPWATRRQMADLFGRDISRITRHTNAIFKDGELDRESNVRKTHIAGSDKPVEIYSLDVVLAVGYRVRGSKQAIMYRHWANSILKQYLLKGFVLDQRRLENPDGRPDFFDDLLNKIRQIRASEKRMWTRVLDLASFCSDYHAMSEQDKQDFFATIQNAMHWAISGETAADFVYRNVDASKPDCGLIHFDRDKRDIPTVTEARTAKNYYGKAEIKALNLLTSSTLEFFESRAQQRRPTTIAQFIDRMREFIKLSDYPVIRADYKGKISDAKKKQKVLDELAAYREHVRLEKETTGEVAVSELLKQARAIASEKTAVRKPKKKASG